MRPLDPRDDCGPRLLEGGPLTLIQDVLLQEGEEGLHVRVVPGRADLAHGTDQPVHGQGVLEQGRAELRAAVWNTMHPATTPVPPRRATACSRASTARDAYVLPAMEKPTIRTA